MIRKISTTLCSLILLLGCSAKENRLKEDVVHCAEIEKLDKYSFVDLGKDTIVDGDGVMKNFIENLKILNSPQRNESLLQLPILHYGDSHIQAGYLTEVVRRRLQWVFGNAGRGFVAPLKLAASNEPRDFSISSPNRFENTKVTNRGVLSFDPGVGGVAVRGELPVFNVEVFDIPEDSLDYSFSRVIAFHDSLAPMVTTNPELMADGYGADLFYSYTTNIELIEPAKKIELYTYKENQFAQGPFYGFSLENNKNGILYHSMGVNSACYLHWGLRDNVAKMSAGFGPQLIILSMGSNEAAGRNFIESVFVKEVNTFVKQLKEANPDVPILITTPLEVMRRTKNGYVPNKNFELVSNALKNYCKDNSIAFLDLFNVVGGANSSKTLFDAGLLQRDRIHFTIEGYELMGVLIFNAIINELLKYDRKSTQSA